MPYVSPADALNLPAVDIDAVSREMGPPPWRKPLVATGSTRWVLLAWPPGFVTVPHVHPAAEETFQVLRGEARFRFGNEDTDRVASVGTVLHAPRGVWHTIGVPGPESLLLLASIAPNEDVPDETIEDPDGPGVSLAPLAAAR